MYYLNASLPFILYNKYFIYFNISLCVLHFQYYRKCIFYCKYACLFCDEWCSVCVHIMILLCILLTERLFHFSLKSCIPIIYQESNLACGQSPDSPFFITVTTLNLTRNRQSFVHINECHNVSAIPGHII